MDTAATTTRRVTPWNQGELLGQKPPLKLKEISAIRIRLQLDHRTRELALFNLAIDSKLRGCDLVALRVHDVVQGSHVAARAIVMQRKTQRRCNSKSTNKPRVGLPQRSALEREYAQRMFAELLAQHRHLWSAIIRAAATSLSDLCKTLA